MVQFVSEQYRNELGDSLWLFKCAASNHDIKIMQYLMEYHPDGISESEATTFLHEENPEIIRTFTHSRGYASLVQRLVAREVTFAYPKMQILQRLCDEELLPTSAGTTTFSIDQRAFHGHLSIIQTLHEKAMATATTDAMDLAASSGNWDVSHGPHRFVLCR